MSPIVVQIPGMEKTVIKSNIVYKTNNRKSKLLMDICYPSASKTNSRYPVVFLINGGCGSSLKLNPKIKAISTSWSKLIAASGVIAISFIWRYKNPEDISDLIKYVCDNSEELHIDKSRFCAFAFSRGVCIGIEQIFYLNFEFIKCIIAYYGKLPTTPLKKSGIVIPPMLIAMAGKDRYFSPTCNDDFINQVREKDIEVIFLSHMNGEHAFEMRNDDEQSHHIVEQTIEFITKNLLENT